MLDRDLAALYGVSTKTLNQAVKRNRERFPEDFMFKLAKSEKDEVVTICDRLKPLKYSSHLPFAFTEHGVAALAGVINSESAIGFHIQIMRAFVAMRRFINDKAELFKRLDSVERKQLTHDRNFEKIFKAIGEKTLSKEQGVFYDGQVFDAHRFISDLIRSARKSIILIDNYVDDTTLMLFTKRQNHVQTTIYTKNFSRQLELDLRKHNEQYQPIMIKEFRDAHDRFLIIDRNKVYHIGASLKDAGKKWFAFSKLHQDAPLMLEKLRHQE